MRRRGAIILAGCVLAGALVWRTLSKASQDTADCFSNRDGWFGDLTFIEHDRGSPYSPATCGSGAVAYSAAPAFVDDTAIIEDDGFVTSYISESEAKRRLQFACKMDPKPARSLTLGTIASAFRNRSFHEARDTDV